MHEPNQKCVLAYTLERILKDRLEAADLAMRANDTLAQLARIQSVSLCRRRIVITKNATPASPHVVARQSWDSATDGIQLDDSQAMELGAR